MPTYHIKFYDIKILSVGLLRYSIQCGTWLHVHITTYRIKFMQVSCDVSRSSCYTLNLCLLVAAGEVRRMSSLFNRSQCRDDTGDDRQTLACISKNTFAGRHALPVFLPVLAIAR